MLFFHSYQDEADTIRITNESKYGLSSDIASVNNKNTERVAKQLDVDMVHIKGGTIDLGCLLAVITFQA